MSLADSQRRLADALTSRTPPEGVDPEGLEVAALLVAKLRFERLVQGSPNVARWFDRDPESFVAAFRDYCRAVPARSPFPAAEARAFTGWMQDRARGLSD